MWCFVPPEKKFEKIHFYQTLETPESPACVINMLKKCSFVSVRLCAFRYISY